jgi:hypothetical protein
MEPSPSWETVTHQLKTFPTFYGTRRFITVFTRTRHCSLPSARWIQFTPPHFISLRYILILSSQLRLVLPSVSFFLAFPPKSLYAYLLCPMVLHTLPNSFSWLPHSNYIRESVRVMKILTIQFCPASHYIIPLRYKYSPQHSVLKYPRSLFFPKCQRLNFTPIQN